MPVKRKPVGGYQPDPKHDFEPVAPTGGSGGKTLIHGMTVLSTEYPDTPDELFKPEKTFKEAEEDLLKFVEKQIELMNENLLFGGQNIPTFYALNKSLMEYEQITLGLLALHQEMRIAKDIANENYENFYAEKYCEIKSQQVSLGKNASFLAAREIEMVVRKQFLKELSQLKAEYIKIENKYNFVNHLISAWDKYSFVLNTLSSNARAEANAAGIGSKNPKSFGDENE